MNPRHLLQVACQAAQSAGEVLLGHFGRRQRLVQKEQSYNLVTQADVEAEQAVLRLLRRQFPDHAMLGEETQDEVDPEAEYLWIVDPLDGTNNFIHGIPHFAVSIACAKRGELLCGAIYNPATGDWFTALRGQGAWHNRRLVRVGRETRLDQVLVGTGFYYDRGRMMQATLRAIEELFQHHIHGLRRFGTASLDLTLVGRGCFGAFFEYELSPWDFAAGVLFVREAGGRVTTCRGEPLPLRRCSLLASNAGVHQQVLRIVQRHHP